MQEEKSVINEAVVEEKKVTVETPAVESVSSETGVTSEQSTKQPLLYAGFWIRWGALIVDSTIILGLVFAYMIAGGVLFSVVSRAFGGVIGSLFGLILLIGFFVFPFVYFIYLTYKQGGTWGKQLFGLAVFSGKENGGSPSLGAIALRETIGKWVSGLIFNIGYIMAGFTDRKRALHDMIADTVVVCVDPSKKKNGIIVVIIVAVITVPIAIIAFGIASSVLLVSLSSARDKAQEAGFKAHVTGTNPALILTCSERNITERDLSGSAGDIKMYDASQAFTTLKQDCGPGASGTYSYSVVGAGSFGNFSALCTEKGCDFSRSE